MKHTHREARKQTRPDDSSYAELADEIMNGDSRKEEKKQPAAAAAPEHVVFGPTGRSNTPLTELAVSCVCSELEYWLKQIPVSESALAARIAELRAKQKDN